MVSQLVEYRNRVDLTTWWKGYPLRIIFPTLVGGRQVKWVNKVWISKTENTSHYHIYDNRVSRFLACEKTC
jgi:hypothetical protein